MKANYPERFEIKFNRAELEKVFGRAELHTVGTVLALPLLILWLFLFTTGINWVSYTEISKWVGVVGALVVSLIGVVVAFALLSQLYFFFWGNRRSKRRATKFSTEVDGAFLRVVDGKSDRKIHFRQIGDYEAILPKKGETGMGVIRMRTTGLNTQFLILHAVEDVIAIRDLLAEVDAERE